MKNTHDEFLLAEYETMAAKIEAAIRFMPAGQSLTAQEVCEMIGIQDFGGMTVGQLAAIAKAKREDAAAVRGRILAQAAK